MLICNNHTKQVTSEDEPRVPHNDEVAWICMISPSGEEIQRVIGDMFHCHPLIVEDCITLNQRPKLDRYKEHVFISFFSINDQFKPLEMGIIFGPNYVITVHQETMDFLENLERDFQEIENRMDHASEVLYHILDRCVDGYSPVVNRFEDYAERMESGLYKNPNIKIGQDIFQLKRHMHQIRRIFSEERTILTMLIHQEVPSIREETGVYFTDIYDHLSREVDALDVFRESVSGLHELQMHMKSDRMNEIMKTLTIVSSIFLPLTFIVGVYGMNFTFMPELDWSYGYLFAWGVILIVAVMMWIFYKRKKWL